MAGNLAEMLAILLSLLLVVVLTFLYRLTQAVGRLDKRLEHLARHLRDLNLYQFHANGPPVLAASTKIGDDTPSENDAAGATTCQQLEIPSDPDDSSATSTSAFL